MTPSAATAPHPIAPVADRHDGREAPNATPWQRTGRDATLVAHGASRTACLQAAAVLAAEGLDVGVIDLPSPTAVGALAELLRVRADVARATMPPELAFG